jgi:uncharacterized protein
VSEVTTLKQRLNDDLRAAMLAGDESRKSTLRLALSAIHNAEIADRGELDDAGIEKVLAREAKQRRESIEEFQKGGRDDLVAVEKAELDTLLDYLPQQLDEAEVETTARRIISESGAAGPADKGKVMPQLMKELAGRADGRLVNEVVTRLLAS